ncbi:hypothetical protein KVT40_005982 [Elsinoe batatas]|uniref:Uncharacterized protein n=1 Tax=Elsinoe batatas TaxID=2601811 RepID=A0A8K0L0V5_9PEZI|nr:hypothetical protein KVT40_005982 [Elsinoe batatas]
MDSLIQAKSIASLPSPTLTNPEMVLPNEAAYVTTSPPRAGRPPSPSYLLDQVGDKDVPRTFASKKSLGSMSRRRGLERSTTEDDNYLTVRLSTGDTKRASRSSTVEDEDSRWNNPEMQRKASFISASTATLDWDAIPDYKYDGEESDIITLDEAGSGTATPTKSGRGRSPAALLRNRSRSRSRSKRRQENSSAELSRRAELILANAKKRLNLMDQNLKGARALTAENLQRAASVNMHKSPYTNRFFRSEDGAYSPESTSAPKFGHVRGRSDNTIVHPPVRSPTGIAAQIVDEESEDWAPAPLRASKSQELPQMRWLKNFRSSSRLQTPTRNISSPVTPTSGQGSDDPGSSPATAELKNQVQELNRRVSLLRDRTREDSLRRQSFVNLRNPNPFTDAERYSKTVVGKLKEENSENNVVSRWSVDSSVKRVSVVVPAASPTSVYSQTFDPMAGKQAKRRSKATDWRPIEPKPKQAEISRFSLVSEGSDGVSSVDEAIEFDLSPTSNARPIAAPAHEDRVDAFDYHNFFLHSTLGGVNHQIDGTESEASDDTARGPAAEALPLESETPEKLREIERTIHKRFSSFDSVSSSTSFATATEGARSRQLSPVKRAAGSDGADSGVGLQDKAKPAESLHKRQLSTHISAQVQAIAAPPSAIAIAALATPGKRQLGLRDRAQMFMLLECIRHACEKLQDQDLDASEGRILRRRVEEARKIMDGTAPVVS